MPFPYRKPFRLETLHDWVIKNKPAYIGMNDNQYSWYCHLMRANKKDVSGIPIQFLNAPAV